MADAQSSALNTTCCIVGGGPAGIMLGFLLARAGVDVTVLEKHKDFFRDFRGDTIHPSTLQLLYELGLLDEFLALPHQQLTELAMSIGGQTLPISDFSHLPTHAKFIVLMPPWDFLNFLSAHAAKLPNFHLLMEHEATGLIETKGRVTGVRDNAPTGLVEIHAKLVVGCDGRHAITRASGHLRLDDTGVPVDILWFRLSRHEGEPENALSNINFGSFFLLINRGDYYQCGFIITKDTFATHIQPAGLDAFRNSLVRLVPFLSNRVNEITSWDQLKLLSIQVNRLTRWHSPGLLCIGDAAHAMSPVGGIGINLAIQDVVAAARILAPALKSDIVTELTLAHIQSRRELPTRITQRFQVMVHYFLNRALGHPAAIKPPLFLRLLSPHPFFRRFMARFIGMGLRPEHILSH
jgi:2-polyprenyl-6-methoxyphenol hydroxylase and related FAD-dependent oxidoreductases